MYFVSILVIGSFISPTVLFVLFFALAKEIYSINKLNKGNDYARMLMIGTAIMTSISCAMTPIAHTFPLMAIGFYESATGEVINWIDYMMIGVPSGLLAAAATFAVLWLDFRKKIGGIHIEASENTAKISRNEIVALIVFLIVVAMWMISGLFPTWIPILKTWTTTIPPMLGVIVLCLFGIFNFNDAIKNGVPWTAIILCSATLAVGKWLTAAELGITDAIGAAMGNLLGTPNTIGLIFAVVAFAIIMTNLMSNIVTTTVAYNLLTPIVIATGVISPVLSTILIGIGASMAYATPPSIAHVALAAGSEYCDSKDMLKYGGIVTIISIVLVTAFGFIFGGIV
jgi:sodium-dependent dicarboxylate transporter 2/3/5